MLARIFCREGASSIDYFQLAAMSAGITISLFAGGEVQLAGPDTALGQICLLLSYILYSVASSYRQLAPTPRDFLVLLVIIGAMLFWQIPHAAALVDLFLVRMIFRTEPVRLARLYGIVGGMYLVLALARVDVMVWLSLSGIVYELSLMGLLVWFCGKIRMEICRDAGQERQMRELALQSDRNLQMALTDGLTGLFNRRAYGEKIECLSQYVLLIVDIDHFKRLNDSFGHAAGDKVLMRLSNIIKLSIRSGDMAFRYGGEEFAIVLPGTSLQMGGNIAERLRSRVEEGDFHLARTATPVTVSIGIAARRVGVTCQSVFEQADEALYEAKQSGRNKVKVYAEGMSTGVSGSKLR